MSFAVKLRPEATGDLLDAARWYQKQRQGLGHEFLDDVLGTLTHIESNPLMYPVVHRNTRRALIHRFPFGIFYRIVNDVAVVVAVMHCGRHPRRWKERT